tara:strand:- start:364 stop:765 length:402 start_codon:yes stop_codon:yes gene_type:complete
MASELKVDKFTGVTTAGSILVTGEGNSTTTNLQQGLCKAWCSFTSVSTTALSDSFNLGSITDNGTGDTSLTVSSAFGNINYTYAGNAGTSQCRLLAIIATPTTTVIRLKLTTSTDNTDDDEPLQYGNMMGDLA